MEPIVDFIKFWEIRSYNSGNKYIMNYISGETFYFHYVDMNKNNNDDRYIWNVHKILVNKFNHEIHESILY